MAPQQTDRTIPSIFDVAAHQAAWAARWEWQRLAYLPDDDRLTLVTDLVWQRGYTLSYLTAYAGVGGKVAAVATAVAVTNAEARLSLSQLAGAALSAAERMLVAPVLPPPADHRTLSAARQAATTADASQPWKQVAQAAWAGSFTAGTIAGTLTAATDILITWRIQCGDWLATDITIDGQPADQWVADLLATVNRDTVMAQGVPVAAAITPPQLARQDQALDAPTTLNATVSAGRPVPALGPPPQPE